MRIRGFLHKSLKRLYVDGNSKGLPPDAVDKIQKMLAFIQDMEVTRNWRLTFRVDLAESEILDVNYEDYH